MKYFIHCVRNLNSTDKRYREVLEGYCLREDTKDGNILFFVR